MEIKKCPFCGGEANIKIVGKSTGEHFGATFEIGCNKCKYYFREESRWYINNGQIVTDKDGYNDCIEKWNRRVEK
jgi:hypothetical protein